MARITVEDCLHNVDNLFQLVLLAAQRARRLANGAEATLPLENDKPTVLALREIAAGNVTAEMLREPEPGARAASYPTPTTSRASARRSSVSETDGLDVAAHGLRVFAPGTAARRKTHSGTEGAAGRGRQLPRRPSRSSRIREAAEFGTSAHHGQKRLSG